MQGDRLKTKIIIGIALAMFSAVMLIAVVLSAQIVVGAIATPYYSEQIVREPRSIYVVVVAGAVITITTAVWTRLGGLVQFFNSTVSKVPIPDEFKDFLQFCSGKIFATVDKTELEALERAPFTTKKELAALGISILIMTFVFGFVEANGLPNFLDPWVFATVIPLTLISVCMISFAGELSEFFCAQTCRVYKQFKLSMYGLGVFLISGLLFLFPFGSPGITRYRSGKLSNETEGLVVLSKMLILLTLTIPFTGSVMLGFKNVGDAGLLLTLMTVCYSLVPLKPFDGKAVFDYRKEVSLIAFVSTGILFFGYTIYLLPHAIYLGVGVVSMCLATITLSRLIEVHTHASKPKKRFCIYCGKQVLLEAKFCIYCGKELKTE
jgi:hypothetical protein